MSETANFESAQALFCAIADKVGSSKINKVLNLESYQSYPDFRLTHIKIIDEIFDKKKIDVDVNRKTIEEFLTKNKSWYISSVKIAVKLINDLSDVVDSDFSDIMKPGYQRNYIRGDKDVVGTIDKLYNIANANTKKNLELMKIPAFGDINKWSPADIYYASKTAKKDILAELGKTLKKTSYSFPELNTFISKLINSGDLLPLSLKKATSTVKIVPVNFDMDVRTKMIDGIYPKKSKKIQGGLWCTKNQKIKTGFESFTKYPESNEVSSIKKEKAIPGIPKEYGEPASKEEQDKIPSSSLYVSVSGSFSRNTEVGFIQMRHDRSNGSWKVDYSPTQSGGRGGSVVSSVMFAKLLAFSDPAVASQFETAFDTGNEKFRAAKKELEKYKDDIRALNKSRIQKKAKKSFNGKVIEDHTTLFQSSKRTCYDYIRGELSSILVTNKVNAILQKWFKDNSKPGTGKKIDKPNPVDDFIRILYRYVTSRSETSAKFVIAK
jgi:hypothetical protein